MSRLISFAALSCLLLTALACQQETTTTVAQPETAPVIAESTPFPDTGSVATPGPIIEPPPTPLPSILRRETATTAAQTETNVVTDEWPPRVSVTELRKMLDQGKAVVVDVRAPQYFQERRIPGSLNLPLAELVLRANEIPEDKTVVTVCT